jgi:predicted sulfurtransferase
MSLLHHIDFHVFTVVLEAISSKLYHLKDKIVIYCSTLMEKREKRIKWMKDEGMKEMIPC